MQFGREGRQDLLADAVDKLVLETFRQKHLQKRAANQPKSQSGFFLFFVFLGGWEGLDPHARSPVEINH